MECPKHPLQIENGYPVTLSTTGKGRAVSQEGERFGYGTKIAFECNEGYRLVESEESTRFCQLNGTWTGTQPHCESKCCIIILVLFLSFPSEYCHNYRIHGSKYHTMALSVVRATSPL